MGRSSRRPKRDTLPSPSSVPKSAIVASGRRDGNMTPEEAHAQFGKIIHFDDPTHGTVIFKKPTRPDYKRLQAQLTNDKYDSGTALESFVKSCAVQPVGKALDALLDDYPALGNEVAAELQELAKPSVELQIKKG